MTQGPALLPKQVVRLCALGVLLQRGPTPYGELAKSVGDFTAHLIAPSVDMMGGSLELLRYDGLVADDAAGRLAITAAGRDEFQALMAARLPTPATEMSKLVVALKVRFLHLIPAERQREEFDILIGLYDREIARLEELRTRHAGEAGHLDRWLEHDIAQNRSRLAWLRALAAAL